MGNRWKYSVHVRRIFATNGKSRPESLDGTYTEVITGKSHHGGTPRFVIHCKKDLGPHHTEQYQVMDVTKRGYIIVSENSILPRKKNRRYTPPLLYLKLPVDFETWDVGVTTEDGRTVSCTARCTALTQLDLDGHHYGRCLKVEYRRTDTGFIKIGKKKFRILSASLVEDLWNASDIGMVKAISKGRLEASGVPDGQRLAIDFEKTQSLKSFTRR